ncbi:zinc finger protein 512B-like isoform X2 [Odontomachus brunneus]|uniref:zinc finger protein 512B-like isoform X2 n=1 Tax=Odontomachus brunneus TaxID=486640 RepID=UPI0013F1B933|nr:zinc finger protein 512B-like isoform X2 [Odontomachus brunneus]
MRRRRLMPYKYLRGSRFLNKLSFSSASRLATGTRERSAMKLLLIMSLVAASSVAVTVENNLRRKNSASVGEKKHGKRGLDHLGYGLQQEHQEHLYGPPAQSPPVYEVPAPDVSHPIPGYIPEPSPPVAVGHPVAVPVPQPIPHPVPQPVAVPVAVPITKHVPFPVPVPIHIDRAVPVAVPVPKPYPVTVERIVPVDRPVPVPVEKPVHIPVDRPIHVPVPVPKPYPITFEKIVHVDRPYPVHVAVPVHIPKPYPVPIAIHAHYKSHAW